MVFRITKPITRKVLPKHCVNVPILTNTTLTVLRYCGKYLHMSQLLRAIASEVITGLGQLFEYYMYAVYTFFTSDLVNTVILYVNKYIHINI